MDTTNLPLKIMKRYNEFTEEEIEDLARECDRMAEENSRLRDLNAELLAALKAQAAVSLVFPRKSGRGERRGIVG
jgi:hypothetical protein